MGGWEDKIQGAAEFELTRREFGGLSNQMGLPGPSPDVFGLTLSFGHDEDIPVPIVVRFEGGSYTDGRNPSFNHNFYRGDLGFRRNHVLFGKPAFFMRTRLDVSPLGVTADLVAPNSLDVQEKRVDVGAAARLGVDVCSNFGSSSTNWRGCFGLIGLDLRVPSYGALDQPPSVTAGVMASVEYGDFNIQNSGGGDHWMKTAAYTLAYWALEFPHLSVAYLGENIRRIPALKEKALLLDWTLKPLISGAQFAFLEGSGREWRYFLPTAVAAGVGGSVEAIMGGAKGDPVLVESGVKNITGGAVVTGGRLLEQYGVERWQGKAMLGGAAALAGLLLETLAGHHPASVGLQEGGTGGLFSLAF